MKRLPLLLALVALALSAVVLMRTYRPVPDAAAAPPQSDPVSGAGSSGTGFHPTAAGEDTPTEDGTTLATDTKPLAVDTDVPVAPAFRLLERLPQPVVAEDLASGELVPSAVMAVTSSTLIDSASLASLERLHVGDPVSFPAPGGGWIPGRVAYRETETETGRLAIAGDLAERPGHHFSLFIKEGVVAATLLLPDEGRALLVQRAKDGRHLLQEKPIQSVICHGMPATPGQTAGAEAPPGGPAAMLSVPLLDSLASATAVLYLDFDGETVSDPNWNGGKTIQALPAILAGNPITPAQIEEVWEMVSEDFRPFRISVTTNVNRYNNASVGRRMRCIVTPTKDVAPETGGVAWVNSFSTSAGRYGHSTRIPCWAFNSNNIRTMAMTISHELGHTLGLFHDGRAASGDQSREEYYGGHGSGPTGWGPLMGAPFGKYLTQWSRGQYYRANNNEDDFALIARSANGFGYRADDIGNTLGTARTVAGNALGSIDELGLLHSSADIDCFRFTTGGGTLNVTCSPSPVEPNLNTRLELRDSAGVLLVESSLDGVLTSTISRSLSAGEYFLMVQSQGEGGPFFDPPTGFTAYGSTGGYRLVGSFAAGGPALSANPSTRSVPKAGGMFEFGVAATGNWSWSQNAGSAWVSSAEPADQSGNETFSYTVAANPGSSPRTATITLTSGSLTATHTIVQADHGDSTATATTVGHASTTAGNIESAGGSDYFRINVPGPGILVVHTTGGTDTYGQLLGASGDELASDDDSGEGGNFRIAHVVEAGVYYVRVSHGSSSGTGAYQLVSAWGTHLWKNFAGMPGASGIVNGTGKAARFYVPVVMAMDGAGNLYVADAHNHTIRKISPAGVVTTLAGSAGNAGNANGTGGSARFNQPCGIAVDGGGNVYAADAFNHTIRKVTPAGVVTTLAGSPGIAGSANGAGGSARFNEPCGIAIDAGGNLYVADRLNHTIRKVTPAGVVTTLAGSPGGAGNENGTGSGARFYYPRGVAVDGSGHVYVVEHGNHAIRRVSPAGVVTTLAGNVADAGNTDGVGSTARFYSPWGIALDGGGNLYVADTHNHTIRKVTREGLVTTLGGSAGSSGTADGLGSAARFYRPMGVLAAPDGSLFVADSFNARISRGRSDDAPVVSFPVTAWGDDSRGQSTVRPEFRAAAVAAGGYHTVALGDDSTVTAWGDDSHGQSTVPPGLGAVVAMAAGWTHTVAVRANGTVAAWGNNAYGQGTVPLPYSGIASVAAGRHHNVILGFDGTVAAWGDNSSGQSTVPLGLNGVVAVAAGGSHTVALRNNGMVTAWGDDSDGQSTVPPGLSGVIAVAAGGYHTVALRSNGTVTAWGDDSHGQSTVPPGLSGVVAISAGWLHTAALKSDGTVVAWGNNDWGQVGGASGMGGVGVLAAGRNHTVALVTTPLAVSPASQSVPTGGDSFDFNVIASGNWSWSLGGGSGWVNSTEPVHQGGGQIFSYTVAPHTGTSSRTATITLTSGAHTAIHTIVQEGIAAGDDHGDTIATATPIAPNSTTAGSIETAGDSDCFRIQLAAAGTLTVHTTGGTDTYGHLLDASGMQLIEDDDGGGEGYNFRIARAVAAGTYYVRVRHWSGTGVGAYQLVSSFTGGTSLSATPGSRSVSANGGSFQFEVASPGSWSWSLGGGSGWVTSAEAASQSGNQTFSYTVAPNPGAGRTATITLTSGALTATHIIVQEAAGEPTRIIGLSGNLAFGGVPVGQTATRLLTITNAGNTALSVTGIGYPAGFGGNWSGGTIAPGGSRNVTVTFAPTAAQSYGGNITVASNATGGSSALALSGMGSSGPAGPGWQAPVGKASSMAVYARVEKDGARVNAAGSLLAVFENGQVAGVGTIVPGYADPFYHVTAWSDLDFLGALSLKVYDAATGGIHDIKETLYFAANGTVGSIEAPVLFTVLSAPPQTTAQALIQVWCGQRVLSSGRGTTHFKGTVVRRRSKPVAFAVRNVGTANLSGLVVSSRGIHRRDFIATRIPQRTVVPHAATTFRATFRPTSAGARKATLEVRSSAANSRTFQIKVKGRGR